MHRLLLIIFLLVLVACTAQIPTNTGIQGEVFIGPVCPVVQLNNSCPDKPCQANLTILTQEGVMVKKFTTNSVGHFQIPLAPGNYILRPETPSEPTHAFWLGTTF